ncbi:MAG: rhodanese-like domain-containing protein [Parasphingorhabdus sp.]
MVHTTAGLANEPLKPAPPLQPNPQVDYAGFTALTQELQEYRSKRLVKMDQFIDLAARSDAVILDTRSAAAFQFGHIKGAINLPFSDFTEEKLTEMLGDTNRPILIYCNNNFRDNVFPVRRKSAPLALNIPTFINLYGYGYRNIYELNDIVLMSDSRLEWTKLTLDKI